MIVLAAAAGHEGVYVKLRNSAGCLPTLFFFLRERFLLGKTNPKIIAVGNRGSRLCMLNVANSQRSDICEPFRRTCILRGMRMCDNILFVVFCPTTSLVSGFGWVFFFVFSILLRLISCMPFLVAKLVTSFSP